MAKFSGIKGNVAVTSGTNNWGGDGSTTGVKTANIQSWTGEETIDSPDATGFASAGFKETVSANRSFTGTIVMYADDTVVISDGVDTLPTVALKLYDGVSDRQVSGSARLQRISTGANGSTGETATVTYGFVYTGSYTWA